MLALTDLPNGLHDAVLKSIEIDFSTGNVRLRIAVLMSLPDDEDVDTAPSYSDVCLLLYKVSVLSINETIVNSSFMHHGRLNILGEFRLDGYAIELTLFATAVAATLEIKASDYRLQWGREVNAATTNDT